MYTTDVSSSEILDMAEAYLVGSYPTARLTAEERGAKTRLTITTNREQLLEALDAWASRELGATTIG